MNPLALLGIGAALMLLTGIPAIRAWHIRSRHSRHMSERLASLRAPAEAIEELTAPRHEAHFLVDNAPPSMRLALARAGMMLQWRMVILFLVTTAGLSTLPVLIWGWLAGLATALVALGVVGVGLKVLAAHRLKAFVDALPLYLDATRQLITVGNSLQQAMVKAGDGCEPGLSRHLGPLLRRVQFGAPPADCISWLAERLDVTELHMLAAAVQTNARFGGRLSTVLFNLTQIVRDRARVERELRSATAETRMSALVLGALPVVVALFISFSNPSYIDFFINEPQGHNLAAVAVGMEISGVLIMRRLMRIDF